MGREHYQLTKPDKFRPVPVTELVVHGIAPIPRALIFRRSSSLETKPRPLRPFHVTTTNTGLVVQRVVGPTIFFVSGQMEFWNDTSNNLVVQAFCTLEREVFEPGSKVFTPLAHNVVRSDFLRVKVVTRAPDNHIIGIGITSVGIRCTNKRHRIVH